MQSWILFLIKKNAVQSETQHTEPNIVLSHCEKCHYKFKFSPLTQLNVTLQLGHVLFYYTSMDTDSITKLYTSQVDLSHTP